MNTPRYLSCVTHGIIVPELEEIGAKDNTLSGMIPSIGRYAVIGYKL